MIERHIRCTSSPCSVPVFFICMSTNFSPFCMNLQSSVSVSMYFQSRQQYMLVTVRSPVPFTIVLVFSRIKPHCDPCICRLYSSPDRSLENLQTFRLSESIVFVDLLALSFGMFCHIIILQNHQHWNSPLVLHLEFGPERLCYLCGREDSCIEVQLLFRICRFGQCLIFDSFLGPCDGFASFGQNVCAQQKLNQKS